jgi:hypothetical protein
VPRFSDRRNRIHDVESANRARRRNILYRTIGNFCFSSSMDDNTRDGLLAENTLATTDLSHSNSRLRNPTIIKELRDLFVAYVNPFQQFVEVSTLSKPPNQSPADISLDLLQSAICAAGACFADRSDLKEVGELFALHAESLALPCCQLFPNLIVIQALNILCWRDLSLEHENMAWLYNSMAASLCTHLGLHVGSLKDLKDAHGSAKTSIEERNSKIRTFWQFFLVDRIATSLLGRQCTLPWRRVRSPSFDSTFSHIPSLDAIAFDHQCKLWLLHDQYMDQMYDTTLAHSEIFADSHCSYSFEFAHLNFLQRNQLLVEARDALISFHQNIDSRLNLKRESDTPSTVFFQMSYQMSLILIHRPYLRESTESGLRHLAIRSMTAAATSISRMIRSYKKTRSFNRAPSYAVHHVLTAAIMHLLSSTSSQASLRQQAVPRFRICVEALEEMQNTWPRARKSVTLLQELAQRWAVVYALPMRLSYPAGFFSSEHPADNASTSALSEASNGQSNNNTTLSREESFSLGDAANIDWEYTDMSFTNEDSFPDFAINGDSLEMSGLDWLFGVPDH